VCREILIRKERKKKGKSDEEGEIDKEEITI